MPIMTFEVSEEEKNLILKAARERRGMTVSDFIRSCIYLELCCAGDPGAQYLSGRFRRRTVKSIDLLKDSRVRRYVKT
jgi:hypothetical protein